MDAATPVTEATETYARLVLLLFYPFRELSDLMLQGSHTLKFREACNSGVIGDAAKEFMQNVEDARSNSFRTAKQEDDLERNTERFTPADVEHDDADDGDEGDHESDNTLQGQQLDELLELFDQDANLPSMSSAAIPQTFKLDRIRQKGVLMCGYNSLVGMNMNPETHTKVYETLPQGQQSTATQTVNTAEDSNVRQRSPQQREIGQLLLTRTTRRRRTFEEITGSGTPVEVLEANGSVKSILDWANKAKIDQGQKRAFKIFAGSFVLTFHSDAPGGTLLGDRQASLAFSREKRKLELLVEKEKRGSDQLICLLHGPGGCGKTTVIDLLLECAREFCSFMEECTFTARTIVVTAMSGVAATLLLGETTHAAVYLNRKRASEAEEIELWADTCLLIVDEVSFASKEDFVKLHKNLRRLKMQLHLPHGGLDVIFAGDFRQLEPCGKEGKKAVCREDCQEFKDWVNCHVELNGLHRFRDDEQWGLLLLRFRNGEVTLEDIELINERVVDGNFTVGDNSPLPDDVKHAAYFNRNRDAINAALFEKRCEHICRETGHTEDCIVIFSDDLKVRNGGNVCVPFRNCHSFWESCGEDDVKPPRMEGRMDPVLRVHHKCRVMLGFNKDAGEGQAKGTQTEVEKVVLKPGVVPQIVKLGGKTPVAAVRASQVDKLILHHCNDRIQPRTFIVEPKGYSFRANVLKPRALQTEDAPKETLRMKGKQLPILINNATTGHKLQGSGVDSLFVHSWSNVKNWVHVMLSRVKTRGGLFCRKKLSGTNLGRFAVPEGLRKMLEKFERFRPRQWTAEECEELFGHSEQTTRALDVGFTNVFIMPTSGTKSCRAFGRCRHMCKNFVEMLSFVKRNGKWSHKSVYDHRRMRPLTKLNRGRTNYLEQRT